MCTVHDEPIDGTISIDHHLTLGVPHLSTVRLKFLVAATGLIYVLFLIGHFSGNLLIFMGPEAMNSYAQGLRDLGHGALLWLVRLGLIAAMITHVVLTIILTRRNSSARPQNYSKSASLKSTLASRSMMYSGLAILAFLIFHILHFTLGQVQPSLFQAEFQIRDGRMVHDAYGMVITGFKSSLALTLVYVAAMSLVGLHLSHAVQSLFQTLGVTSPKYDAKIKSLGFLLSSLIVVAFLSVPFAIMLHIVE